ncbi:MAG: oligopeptide transport system permease protein [Aliidongia sp.]|jgi:oligopeptide transport system permease protein|nr:oligopeptide transport system permease protein [Aliidongia sp.]
MTDAAVQPVDHDAIEPGRDKVRDGFARLRRNHLAVAGIYIFGFIMLACVVGPWFIPFDPETQDYSAISNGPSFSSGHLFGTDDLGRDLLVRLLLGGRTSLAIGILAAIVAVVIGTGYGAVAGYFGGAVDQIMMRTIDVLYGLPFLFFIIMLTLLFGRGMLVLLLAFGSLAWLTIAVIVRGQTLSLKQKDFIEAARAGGMKPMRIVRRHIVPNTIGPVIVYASLLVPDVIIGESFLSYLGLGVQEPMSSWGTLIDAGTAAMDTEPYQLLFPGGALALTLFSLNFIADGLRDAFDPKDR